MKLMSSTYDPQTGFTEETWVAPPKVPGGPMRVTIRRLQDVDACLDGNNREFNSFSGKKPSYSDSCGIHKVATIPLGLIEKWHKEGFNWYNSTDKERKARLNSREYRKLLTRPGKL